MRGAWRAYFKELLTCTGMLVDPRSEYLLKFCTLDVFCASLVLALPHSIIASPLTKEFLNREEKCFCIWLCSSLLGISNIRKDSPKYYSFMAQ